MTPSPVAGQVRLEVSDEHGTAAVIIGPPDVPAGRRGRLAVLAGQAAAEVAALPGVAGEGHAREILLTALVRQYADELAYERVAAQRGLLPL